MLWILGDLERHGRALSVQLDYADCALPFAAEHWLCVLDLYDLTSL